MRVKWVKPPNGASNPGQLSIGAETVEEQQILSQFAQTELAGEHHFGMNGLTGNLDKGVVQSLTIGFRRHYG